MLYISNTCRTISGEVSFSYLSMQLTVKSILCTSKIEPCLTIRVVYDLLCNLPFSNHAWQLLLYWTIYYRSFIYSTAHLEVYTLPRSRKAVDAINRGPSTDGRDRGIRFWGKTNLFCGNIPHILQNRWQKYKVRRNKPRPFCLFKPQMNSDAEIFRGFVRETTAGTLWRAAFWAHYAANLVLDRGIGKPRN